MGEILTLVFGSGASLTCAASTLEQALRNNGQDYLLGEDKIAKSVVLSADLPIHHVRQVSVHQKAEAERAAEETWSGQVHSVVREFQPKILRGDWWDINRSWARLDKDAFVDNVRHFLESCDVFHGAHTFLDVQLSKDARDILTELRDDVVGLRFPTQNMIFAYHDDMGSAVAAVNLASNGSTSMTRCYVPLQNLKHEVITNYTSGTINAVTLPYRVKSFKRTMDDVITPVIPIPGEFPIHRLWCEPSPVNIGLSSEPSNPVYGGVYVNLSSNGTRKDPFESLTELKRFTLDDSHISSSIECAGLFVDSSCGSWMETLSKSLASLEGSRVCRLMEIEEDERREMRDQLIGAADSLVHVL